MKNNPAVTLSDNMAYKEIQHFILTRFNLLLWSRDKAGNKVRTREWLEHRFSLFERYCLPSVMGQACKDFEWIVLFDSTTPEEFRERIRKYQEDCPQLEPVFVKPENGRHFKEIFRNEVVRRLTAKRVITTYLDNDDALGRGFVKDVQQRALRLKDMTFVTYADGYQFFTDAKYMMRVRYRRNHFMSVVENGEHSAVKTIYGYGSHYYIDRIPGVRMENVKGCPLWCEVIHDKNMGNDAYFLVGTRMVGVKDCMRTDFGVDETVNSGAGIWLFRFLPRYIVTFARRVKYFITGRRFA